MPKLRLRTETDDGSRSWPDDAVVRGGLEDYYEEGGFMNLYYLTKLGTGTMPPSLPFFGMDGYIHKERSHILSATPKTGKTTLICQCLSDWVTLGEKILILSEEHLEDWGIRNRKDHLVADDSITIGSHLSKFTQKELIKLVRERGESILLIDTLFAMGCLGENENDGSKAQTALTPWIEMCRETRKTFIGLHHNNKGGGSQIQRVSGSVKILGAFDVIITMDRREDGSTVVVEKQSKYGASPRLKYRRNGERIVMETMTAPTREAKDAARRTDPLLCLPTNPPGISLVQYRELVGGAQNDCLQQLNAGIASGRVIMTLSGLRGTKKLYYRKF